MTLAGGVLAGAGSRLLPASVPFRFFGAAVAFHVVAWLAALAGADALPAFAGGLGWPLASLHAITLGVLAMTAIGASLVVSLDRDPVFLYPELAEQGWVATRIAGDAGEVLLRVERVAP